MTHEEAAKKFCDIVSTDDIVLEMLFITFLERFSVDEIVDLCIDTGLLLKNKKICNDNTRPFLVMRLLQSHDKNAGLFNYSIFEAYFEQTPEILKKIESINYDEIWNPESETFAETKDLIRTVDSDLAMLFLTQNQLPS